MRLDISFEMLSRNAKEIGLILLVMLIVKLIPGLLLRLRNMKWPAIFATSSLLAAPLTLVIAIMELGVKNGPEHVTPEMSATVICAGIAASLLFPSVARKLLRDESVVPAPASQAVSWSGLNCTAEGATYVAYLVTGQEAPSDDTYGPPTSVAPMPALFDRSRLDPA